MVNAIALDSPSMTLTGIRWQTYEALVADLSRDRRLRVSFLRGKLEIREPLPEHERFRKLAGRLVETIAEGLGVAIAPFGSTTLRRPELAGAEPDECFYVRNLQAVCGLRRLDLERDPPPDLVVEIDITSSSVDRLGIYGVLGVGEVWRYDGTTLTIYGFLPGENEGDRYQVLDHSGVFPMIPVAGIEQFLQRAIAGEHLQVVREFWEWVRSRLTAQQLFPGSFNGCYWFTKSVNILYLQTGVKVTG